MEIFKKICRACNTENPNLLSIFNNQQYEESVTIKNMLESCLQTPIENNAMYPNLICYFCIKQLEISYRFLQRFKLAQKEFEEAYKHMKRINENNNSEDIEVVHELGVRPEGKLSNVCVVLPDYFQKVKKGIIKLDTTTENVEHIMNTHLPTKDEPRFSSLPATTCSICNKTFLTVKAFNMHLKLTHKQCKNELKREHEPKIEYMDAIKTMKTGTTKSNINVKLIAPVNNVQAMEVLNKSDDLPAEQCSICDKLFFTTKALNLHLKLAHKQKSTT